MFAKPMEKPNVACLWHCEIVYHHENHLSLSFKNNMAFFLFICQFSCLLVSASCAQTSKSYFFPCRKDLSCWSTFRLLFPLFSETFRDSRIKTSSTGALLIHYFSLEFTIKTQSAKITGTREKQGNPGVLENISRGRQTGVNQEAKRLKKKTNE